MAKKKSAKKKVSKKSSKSVKKKTSKKASTKKSSKKPVKKKTRKPTPKSISKSKEKKSKELEVQEHHKYNKRWCAALSYLGVGLIWYALDDRMKTICSRHNNSPSGRYRRRY